MAKIVKVLGACRTCPKSGLRSFQEFYEPTTVRLNPAYNMVCPCGAAFPVSAVPLPSYKTVSLPSGLSR
jgi:hypothetical protein